MEAAIPMIADVHLPSTDRTIAVKDVESPQREIRVRRPLVSHPAELRDHEPAIDSRDQFSRYVRNSRVSSPLPDRCLSYHEPSEFWLFRRICGLILDVRSDIGHEGPELPIPSDCPHFALGHGLDPEN